MSNRIYSDEEVEQLFKNLVKEQSKVKDLERRLQHFSQRTDDQENESSSVSKDMLKMKKMLNRYRRKNLHSIEDPKLTSSVRLDNSEVQSLRTQIQELRDENLALIEQQTHLKGLYEKTLTEMKKNQSFRESLSHESSEFNLRYQEQVVLNRRQRDQIEKLTLLVQEREKRVRELQSNELTIKKISDQQHELESQMEQERLLVRNLRTENGDLHKILADSQKQTEQMGRVLKHLRERAEESHLELNQLREDFQRSQEAISQLTQQKQLNEAHFQEQSKKLENVSKEKQEIAEELQILQGQFAGLRARIFEGQETIKVLKEDKLRLEGELKERLRYFDHLELELSSIKEVLSKGIQEAKEIESRYLIIVNEKTVLFNKVALLEEQLDRQKQEKILLQKQLEDALEKEHESKSHLKQLETHLQNSHKESMDDMQKRLQDLEESLQKHHDLLRLKEQLIEENQVMLSQISQEKYALEDSLATVTRYQDEQEARIKVAQQHLGKKVKEVALLNEKIEEQKNQITDLQASLNQFKLKMNETQIAFEQQLQQEKKNQDQLHETVRFAETQVVKWEEKYLKAYEKLKVLEEKQQQMQSLFASLGNVMGGTQQFIYQNLLPNTQSTPIEQKKPISFMDSPPQLSESPTVESSSNFGQQQPSLFDVEHSRSIMRQNLFD